MRTQLGLDGTMQTLENTRQLVAEIMGIDPKTREDDFNLIFRVWLEQGIIVPKELQEEIKRKGSAPETITRCRRELQNTQRILQPSKNTMISRNRQEERYHERFKRK